MDLLACLLKKFVTSRSSRPDVFFKNVFLEISQNSQENTCSRASFLVNGTGTDDSSTDVLL